MQLIVSKKLDARDAAKSRGQPIIAKPDYRQKLEEQIRMKKEQQAKVHAKAARRAAAQDAGQSSTPAAPAAVAAAAAVAVSNDKNGPVSLSKTIEQQRQSKRDRLVHAKSQAELNAEKKAAQAEAAAAAAAAAAADEESSDGKVAPKITFTTEMRPGESFRSYQARLVAEKSRLMNAEVDTAPKGLSQRKKRKLDERDEKKKERRSSTLDPAERKVREEREAKDRLDIARGFVPGSSEPSTKRQRREDGPIEFEDEDHVKFGEVADRPPTLTMMPKSKTLKGKMDADRVIDSLLLMQEKKSRKAGREMDEQEKREWIEKQRDLNRRKQLAEEEKERQLADLREQSLAAYKASKAKRKEEEVNAKLNGTGGKSEEPYVKKSILKKQRRNRERMQAFKDQRDLELDMEIEMADNFDA